LAGGFASYEQPEDWLPELEKGRLSSWTSGQRIFRHNEESFEPRAEEDAEEIMKNARLLHEGHLTRAAKGGGFS
jgi:hypothetical protein